MFEETGTRKQGTWDRAQGVCRSNWWGRGRLKPRKSSEEGARREAAEGDVKGTRARAGFLILLSPSALRMQDRLHRENGFSMGYSKGTRWGRATTKGG